MKKRKTAVLLALVLSITAVFTACGASSQGGSSQAKPESQAESADQPQLEGADQPQLEGADQPQPEGADQAQPQSADQPQSDTGANEAIVVSSEPVADKFHIELQEIGRVSAKEGYEATNNYSLIRYDDDIAYFCDLKGNIVDNRPLTNMAYLGWDLYSVTLDNAGKINNTGLVSAEGDILIPFDASIITFPWIYKDNTCPRYLVVCIGTEQTSNPDEAMIDWTTDSGVLYYKGVNRIFDLETRQYINGLEFEKGDSYDFAQVGDNILSRADDKATVYSPDGKIVYTAQLNLFYNHASLLDFVTQKNTIMDANGNELYSTDDYLGMLDYSSDYLYRENDNDTYTAINVKGEPVLSGEWSQILSETKGRFIVQKEVDSPYALVASDGTEIITTPYQFSMDWLGFTAFGDGTNYTVVTPGSRIIEGLEDDPLNLVFTRDGGTSYLVLNTGEFVSAEGYTISGLSKGVAQFTDSEGKFFLTDVFTGEELTGFDYDTIVSFNNDYIFCTAGDDIVILKVVIVPEY